MCEQNRRKLVCLQTVIFLQRVIYSVERARASAEGDSGRKAGPEYNVFLFPHGHRRNPPRFLFFSWSRLTLDKIDCLWTDWQEISPLTCSAAYCHQWISISFVVFLADALRVLSVLMQPVDGKNSAKCGAYLLAEHWTHWTPISNKTMPSLWALPIYNGSFTNSTPYWAQ